MPNALEQLQQMTVMVADTGDVEEVKKYRPQDCTTNPSLILAALESPSAADLVDAEIAKAKGINAGASELCDTLTVALGAQLAGIVPGRVSTEVDARLSFDIEASVRRAHGIIEDYERRGVNKDRVLIKLAATWEGIQAAARLEREGINCNLTLLFCLDQAKACADAGAYLISPFVGRITDWYKAAEGVDHYAPSEDPGVKSVREIYQHFKARGIETIVMGASFRSTDQILALAGCDRLTIAPKLLQALSEDESTLSRQLGTVAASEQIETTVTQEEFRWGLNGDPMATEKLAQGIRGFDADHRKLLSLLADRLT